MREVIAARDGVEPMKANRRIEEGALARGLAAIRLRGSPGPVRRRWRWLVFLWGELIRKLRAARAVSCDDILAMREFAKIHGDMKKRGKR